MITLTGDEFKACIVENRNGEIVLTLPDGKVVPMLHHKKHYRLDDDGQFKLVQVDLLSEEDGRTQHVPGSSSRFRTGIDIS